MATGQAFCLRRNHHLTDMVDDLAEALKDESMVDVTLMTEDGLIKAHRIILSVCSAYFKQIFSRVNHSPLQYPIIIIQHISFSDLKYIVEFMYHGEVTVPEEQLTSVLRSAELLKVKGLADINCVKAGKSSSDDAAGRRKKKRKRRKPAEKRTLDKHVNSSEDASEYSDEEDDLSPQHSQSSHPTNTVPHSAPSTGATINETEIEPSRLLEQTMITGDAQNIQSLSQKYPPYLISSVKQMMYDDSSGLLANQMTNDAASDPNLALAPFDESGSLVGPNVSLLTRQGEDHAFNSGAAQLMPSDGSSAGHSNSAAGLLPMQIPLGTLSAASLPVTAGPLRPSSLSFNFESLSTKRHYSCPVCYKTFSEKGNMKRHTAIHEQIRPRYICDTCGKCFVWKDNHARHIRISHPNVPS